MVHEEEQVAVDRVSVAFDDERAVSDAGVMLVATLAERLGSRLWPGGWCSCGGIGPGPRTPAAR